MATLAMLTAEGTVIRHEPDLERWEQPTRFTYFAPGAHAWCSTDLKAMARDRGRNETPHEQVEQLLYEFAIGRPMAYALDYRKLDPLGQHVWELKTVDVGLVGWFARKGCIVIVRAEMKRVLQSAKLYRPLIEATVAFRTSLDLDPPKEITGVLHHDVL